MPVIVDQINDMIQSGVPIDQINKFKENKILEMRQSDIPPEKISEAFGAVPYNREDIKEYWKSISKEVALCGTLKFLPGNFSWFAIVNGLSNSINSGL